MSGRLCSIGINTLALGISMWGCITYAQPPKGLSTYKGPVMTIFGKRMQTYLPLIREPEYGKEYVCVAAVNPAEVDLPDPYSKMHDDPHYAKVKYPQICPTGTVFQGLPNPHLAELERQGIDPNTVKLQVELNEERERQKKKKSPRVDEIPGGGAEESNSIQRSGFSTPH